MRGVTPVVRSLFALVVVGLIANCADGPTAPERNTPAVSLAVGQAATGETITTDKDDYAPGETILITGSGWQAGDSVDFVLTEEPATHEPHTWTVGADDAGGFVDDHLVVQDHDLGVTFTLTATSRATGATATAVFTDAAPTVNSFTINGTTFLFPAAPPNSPATNPITVAPGANLTVVVNGTTIENVGGPPRATWKSTQVAFRSASVAFGDTPPMVCNEDNVVDPSNPTTTSKTLTVPAPTAAGTYDVRVRADQDDGCTGGGSLTQNGVVIVSAANAAPSTPATLAQFKSNGTTSIATGGATNETTVVLKGSVSDPDAGNTVKLQVEVRAIGTPFSNVSTGESGFIASGSTAAVTVASLVNGTSYHWQARAVDNNGATSAWVSFGGNSDGTPPTPPADTDFLVDTDRPTVTINQGASQADPTNASPIVFDVVFSETVLDFATGDVTVTGTAGATTGTVTGSGTTYTVSVSDMTGDGTVIANIAQNVAHDAAGNGNVASTFTDNTVTYDTKPPAILNFGGTGDLALLVPTYVPVGGSYTIRWRLDDTNFGNSNITAAAYSIDGGTNWVSATNGALDSPTEDLEVSLTAGAVPDIMKICVRGTDAAANTNQVGGSVNPVECQFLAVYDPNAGFVTGGGWIDSPPEACLYAGCTPSTVGKANFGFVSKYLKGANKPSGNTEFQFHAGNLNFSSYSYEWLVVQGSDKATYKGEGTINGSGQYGFMLSAYDGGSTYADKFRIKIWDKATSAVVYDNQPGAADDADPGTGTPLSGGSIVIHTSKK